MKCESCKTREIETKVSKCTSCNDAQPYKLCFECANRLENYALRPMEFFNLAAIHGLTHYLHDDFYDWDTGEAEIPNIDVVDSEKFPYPTFDEVKNNLDRLIDYSFAQYDTDGILIEQFHKFDKTKVLDCIDRRVKNNNSIADKAYEIVARVLGKAAENWAREQWENRKAEAKVSEYAELISGCFEFEEAFEIITNELEKSDEKTFQDDIFALLYLKSDKTLDWLETQTEKMKTVMWASSFGRVAACSQFSWQRCEKWLSKGRPLSLIALDALYLCTIQEDYVGPLYWLRKQKPTLTNPIEPVIIVNRLHDFLKIDGVPRTQKIVEMTVNNLLADYPVSKTLG